MDVIRTYNLIAKDPQLAARYLPAPEQAITHFGDMFRLLVDDSMQYFQRRWNTLPYNLKIREYHSPQRIREALNMTPMYKQTIQRHKLNSIVLRHSPPLLFVTLEGEKEQEERK